MAAPVAPLVVCRTPSAAAAAALWVAVALTSSLRMSSSAMSPPSSIEAAGYPCASHPLAWRHHTRMAGPVRGVPTHAQEDSGGLDEPSEVSLEKQVELLEKISTHLEASASWEGADQAGKALARLNELNAELVARS